MATRRRLTWLVAASVLVFGGFALMWLLRPAEPSHAGHSLSYWLRRTYTTDQKVRAQAEEAIQKMGSNAVPTLIRWLPERDPQWIEGYNDTIFKLFGRDWNRAAPFLAGGRSRLAANALGIIGPNAGIAIPSIIENMTNSSLGRGAASPYALALGQIGSGAILPLANALTNSDQDLRWHALLALRLFDETNIASVMPELINVLQSSDIELKTALTRLIAYPRGDYRAMETLITLLDDSSYEVKRAAADSLAEMGSAGKPALPKLIALLQNSDTNLQEAIRFAITTIDTNLIIEGNQVRQGSGLNAPK